MKRKKFMFTPTSFVANGAMFNNAVEADVAVENNTLLAIQAQTSDMKQCLDDFSLVKNSPSCDLMSLERDRVKNAIIGNSSAGISPKSIDLERIMKKMENLERENKNLRDCIFSEQKEINSPKLSLTNDFRQMCDALNIVSKEKLAAEKKLFTILRICKDTQASLTSAMHRINEIEGLVESQLK
uniref:Uncharacterized protein n=1 Tax=Romanomermis culicivorax TaxID=13658 RepID=A0A915HG11_ROMCU